MTVEQPFENHNGGWLAFGPKDGLLYVALGDGGDADDPGNLAQNLGELLGKMLRIDVNGDDFPGDPLRNYAVPTTNPFRTQPGAPTLIPCRRMAGTGPTRDWSIMGSRPSRDTASAEQITTR